MTSSRQGSQSAACKLVCSSKLRILMTATFKPQFGTAGNASVARNACIACKWGGGGINFPSETGKGASGGSSSPIFIMGRLYPGGCDRGHRIEDRDREQGTGIRNRDQGTWIREQGTGEQLRRALSRRSHLCGHLFIGGSAVGFHRRPANPRFCDDCRILRGHLLLGLLLFRFSEVWACTIPGPQKRGTGGTRVVVWKGHGIVATGQAAQHISSARWNYRSRNA